MLLTRIRKHVSENKRRFTVYAKAIYLFMMFSFVGSILVVGTYIARTCPRVADESSGHIYRTNMHGVVYLTLADRWLYNMPWGILASAIIFGLIAQRILSSKDN